MINSQKKKNLITLLILSILGLTCIFSSTFNVWITKFFLNQNIVTKRDNLLVHFISVGQGDAIAINLPDERVVLIDTGTIDYSVDYTDYLYENVLSNSKNRNIDYLILSHADADHIGGTKRLIQNFNVKKIILPVIDSETEIYTEIKSEISKNNIDTNIVEENELSDNGYKFNFYFIEDEDTNASSTVVKLSYKNLGFLFAGDIDIEAENKLISKYGEELDSDVLKVAHHGSKMSTSKEFLEIVTPKYAVISCAKNSYGHPTDTVLKNLSSAGAEIYRTDVAGNLLFVVDNAVGLRCLKYNYHITNLWFNYALIVLIVEVLILVKIVVDFVNILRRKAREKKLLVKKS